MDRATISRIISDNPAELKNVPPEALDSTLLARYGATGKAYDLFELCDKSGIPIERVALLVVAGGLDGFDRLPGYAVTDTVYQVANRHFSREQTRRVWGEVRTRHSPSYLEGKRSREQMRELAADPGAYRRYHVQLYFQAWAVYWDDAFLVRMIEKGDSRVIASVPRDLISERVSFAAVSRWGSALRYVPDFLRTLPVCLKAVENDPSAIAFVPARLRSEIRRNL